MLKFMTNFSTVFAFLFISAIAAISLAVVLGISIGIGWILTLIFPFTLFQGSVLGMFAAIIVVTIWYNLLASVPVFTPNEYGSEEEGYEGEEGEYEEEYDEIPTTRFYKEKTDQTWEAWFRYQIANGIYMDFQDSPRPVARMGQKQIQELAIRLADMAVTMCKRKPPHTKTFKITMSSLKQEMTRIGQRPYDDDILKLAVEAINDELGYDDVQDVIRTKRWEELSDMFE